MASNESTDHLPSTSAKASIREEWSHSDYIKRESRQIYNKLHSISADSSFVCRIHTLHPSFLLIANLRCGAWYTDPSITSAVSYFKSTDGHTHQWSFSLKRSNLHLVPSILKAGGAVVVDSTRRGKIMPDALSKTIPTWCAVLNEASRRKYGVPEKEKAGLETPRWMIPPSEHDQIQTRIDGFVQALLDSDLEVPRLETALRPVFVTPQSDLDALSDSLRNAEQAGAVPIVLASASRFVDDSANLGANVAGEAGREGMKIREGYVYVQGAGDDHENWARGLTPDVFWKHREELLACDKFQLEAKVDRLVAQEAAENGSGGHWFTPNASQTDVDKQKDPLVGDVGDVKISNTGVFVGSRSADYTFTDEERQRYGLILHFASRPKAVAETASELSDKLSSLNLLNPPPSSGGIYALHLSSSKKDMSAIRTAFPPAIDIAHNSLTKNEKVLICCQTGKDLSGSLIVAILTSCFTNQRTLIQDKAERENHLEEISKDTTRRRLQWLVSANPRASPSRAYLLRVNELLLSHRFRPDQKA
ncbi:hypothetical protein NDA18_003323 [Ustilago nuda]|nr:hypothetical protein NDA18_003323 [Ustilago nuda]